MSFQDGHLVTDAIVASNAWTAAFEIPGVPLHRNPHIYCAYMTKLAKRWPVAWLIYEQLILPNILDYIQKCESPLGFVSRFPESGETSHDEIMGAAYHSNEYAQRALAFLDRRDGVLTPEGDDETKNVYRFIFLRPYLRACAGERLGIATQLAYISSLLPEIFTGAKGKGTSGILMQWMMNEKMEKFPLVAAFIGMWRWRLEAQGCTAQKIFQTSYLTECPIFAQLAQEDMS